ncbi:MAG TPA: hypothetical protein VG815_10500, partial [Chloroflexota bacterium]|nr:hypothetical protein [Chloroflexota bacterium]
MVAEVFTNMIGCGVVKPCGSDRRHSAKACRVRGHVSHEEVHQPTLGLEDRFGERSIRKALLTSARLSG